MCFLGPYRHDQVCAWNGGAMRIPVRVAQGFIDPILQVFGDDMFQAAGFLVDSILRIAEAVHQPGLDQAMEPDDL